MNRRHAIRQAIESLEQRVLFSTITVNTLADETIANSTTSLREAITKAASGDTIQFGVTGTIQLNPTELAINKNLTITGPGASKLTVLGTSTSRVFNIQSGKAFTLNSLTLAGGHAGADGGGAILNAGALTLNNCTLRDNLSSAADAEEIVASGGAIRSDDTGSTLAVTGCTFTGNQAEASTGIANQDTFGGAIYSNGNLTLTNSTFSINRAWSYGGAVYAFGSGVSISGCTFNDNVSEFGEGGALLLFGALSNVKNSTFRANLASSGDAGAISAFGTLTISGSTFDQNHARGGLGGALNVSGALLMSDCSVINNVASSGGGLNLDLNSSQSSSILRCWIGNATEAGGDGVGGGLRVTSSGSLTVTDTTFSGNRSLGAGGAAYLSNGNVSFVRCLITGGRAGGGGGGVYIAPDATVKMANCTIHQNYVSSEGGAGLYVDGGALSLIGCTVTLNQSAGFTSGGGLFVRSGMPSIANTIIANNFSNSIQSPDVSGVVHSEGYNLIGQYDGSSGWTGSDLRGTIQAPLNALLGPLADNGGKTVSISPLDASPAIDAGKKFGLFEDQRAKKRPVDFSTIPNASGGDGSDIGALERQVTPTQTQLPFATVNIGTTTKTIQAENFDYGREGVAYHDIDPSNAGTWYRTSGVYIQPTFDNTNGYTVAKTRAGEWIEYTVNVQNSGLYDFAFRVLSGASGASLHLEVDGTNVTGALAVPNTGSAWQTITKKQVQLAAGTHVLRLAFDKNASNLLAGNVDYFTVTPVGTIMTDTAALVRDGGSASTNFGSSPALEVKKSTVGYNRESYLKFNIDTIGTLSSAKLRVFGHLLSTENPSMDLLVNDASSSWNESTITWNNRPPAQQSVGAFTVTGTTSRWYEIDVTNYLKAAKAAGKTTVTFVIRSAQTTTATCGFNSDEAATSQPHLVWA